MATTLGYSHLSRATSSTRCSGSPPGIRLSRSALPVVREDLVSVNLSTGPIQEQDQAVVPVRALRRVRGEVQRSPLARSWFSCSTRPGQANAPATERERTDLLGASRGFHRLLTAI